MFKPGQSGNPSGRPKSEHSFNALLARILEESIKIKGKKMTRKEGLVRALIEFAMTGNMRAFEIIFAKMGESVDLSASAELHSINILNFGEKPNQDEKSLIKIINGSKEQNCQLK